MIGPAAGVVPQKSEDGARLLWHGGVADDGLGGYCFRHSGGIVKNGTQRGLGRMDGPDPERRRRRGAGTPSVNLLSLTGLWMEMLASIAGLGLLGFAFDRWLGWFPWLTVTGVVLGVIGGLYNAVKKAMRLQSSESHGRKRD